MKKISLFGLPFAVLSALIFLLSSCATLDEGVAMLSGGLIGGSVAAAAGDDGVPKTLSITGIEEFSGDVLVTASSTARPASSMVAVGGAAISGSSVTIPLVQPGREDERWTGTGNFFITLVFQCQYDGDVIYFYSEGGASARRFTFYQAAVVLSLSQFRRL